jgi:hypothetical protein
LQFKGSRHERHYGYGAVRSDIFLRQRIQIATAIVSLVSVSPWWKLTIARHVSRGGGRADRVRDVGTKSCAGSARWSRFSITESTHDARSDQNI